MFCTQCGTEVDPAKKFCKECGARVGRNDGGGEALEPESSGELSGQDVVPPSAAPATRGLGDPTGSAPRAARKGGKTLPIAIGAALLLVAGAGIYLGTRSSPAPIESPPPPPVQEPIARAPDSIPGEPLPSFEDGKEAPPRAETAQDAVSGAAGVEAAPVVEPPKAAALEKPKPPPVETPRRAAAPAPQRRAGQESPRSSRPAPAPAARATASAGVYETLRSTAVYEDPSSSARVVANIPAGVRVNVVASTGDWLEVHSRRGNPPGFIRRGDAVPAQAAN